MKVVAHRGASFYAPENTFAAFFLAVSQGADGIEMDVHITKDGEVVVIHDKTTERVGDRYFEVSEISWNELKKVDVGSYFGKEFKGEKIPLLKDVIRKFKNVELYVEIKSGMETVEPVVSLLRKVNGENIILFSFNYDLVKEIKKRLKDVRVLFIAEYGYNVSEDSFVYDYLIELVKSAGLDGISTCSSLSHGRKLSEKLNNEDFIWNVWTVDNPYLAVQFKKLGVSSLTTNRPDWILSHVR
ncbi:glycerophosphodiester phosphodiesterase [Desulfurobacterium atlanticum]|uniref:Glycerophosphoryl diester phosphodiesterase n=1 Tax=Desulfurobacterium atlanticum TaxID=240169 RepID=A0A238YEY4_9BACT|nr:glycerophosphodiester phosphodiesterase family protein [Desulfurobacterium atlanticum]SNR69301.1 glycerophosphoryl diester phosphodiesterase [Desulfurobacterium atlanticum]